LLSSSSALSSSFASAGFSCPVSSRLIPSFSWSPVAVISCLRQIQGCVVSSSQRRPRASRCVSRLRRLCLPRIVRQIRRLWLRLRQPILYVDISILVPRCFFVFVFCAAVFTTPLSSSRRCIQRYSSSIPYTSSSCDHVVSRLELILGCLSLLSEWDYCFLTISCTLRMTE
jgi:hypothetical protein